METKRLFISLACTLAVLTSCKEKVVDSADITVLSPKSHQVIEDKDSVRIEAVIQPQNAFVVSYSITVKNKHDKLLFSAQRGCDCKSQSKVNVEASFLYNIDKTSDVFLEIIAVLDDSREIREKVPFVLVE